jgi:hypothetical protein
MKDPKSYDLLSYVVLFAGIYEGVLPFVGKLFGWTPMLSLPLRLSGPAWWIVSAVVCVVAFLLLWALDAAKTRRFPDA